MPMGEAKRFEGGVFMSVRRDRAIFIYAMNPKVLCNVDMHNIFIVHPISGPFKGSDRTFNPKEHELMNPEEMEKACAYLDLFPQVGIA